MFEGVFVDCGVIDFFCFMLICLIGCGVGVIL